MPLPVRLRATMCNSTAAELCSTAQTTAGYQHPAAWSTAAQLRRATNTRQLLHSLLQYSPDCNSCIEQQCIWAALAPLELEPRRLPLPLGKPDRLCTVLAAAEVQSCLHIKADECVSVECSGTH